MAEFRLSPRAQRDLEGIFAYTAQHWGIEQAERYDQRIEAVCRELAFAPEIAPRCDDLRKGYRRWNVASHAIFFRVTERGIAIMRILHGSMDPRRHL